MSEPRCLNLGCGPTPAPGWVNADILTAHDVVYYDLTRGPWAESTGSFLEKEFDLIVLNHVLQMVPHHQVVTALENVRHSLAPGGTLRVLVPDLMSAVHEYENGAVHHLKVSDETEPTIDGKLCAYLSQAGTTRSFYTEARLQQVLKAAAFNGVAAVPPGDTTCRHPKIMELDSRLDESLIAEAWV